MCKNSCNSNENIFICAECFDWRHGVILLVICILLAILIFLLCQVKARRNRIRDAPKCVVELGLKPIEMKAGAQIWRGSLYELLNSSALPNEWGFRIAFAQDIINELNLLHSRGVAHGNLTLNECLVDDKWTIKLTNGIGDASGKARAKDLKAFGQILMQLEDYASKKKLMEDLDDICTVTSLDLSVAEAQIKKTKAETVQTWVNEINDDEIEEKKPESIQSESSESGFVASVLSSLTNDISGEATIKTNGLLKARYCTAKTNLSFFPSEVNPFENDYTKLIAQCLSARPPSAAEVQRQLADLNPYKETTLEMMMKLLETYTDRLRLTVAERTRMLNAERARSDRLLHAMLPRQVASKLRSGRAATAEYFASCSLCFTDIVGFTDFCDKSTPQCVVSLLNELYTLFDDALDLFDVYKVETIGDAYVVASGLPARTDRHAHMVCSLALHMVELAKTFVIPNQLGVPLKIRVGVHSGPVCAGVVGTRMPRYCVFGDTVNVAARMESTSEPYRIQLSHATHQLLGELFRREMRGEISVKGKGKMMTWWLLKMN